MATSKTKNKKSNVARSAKKQSFKFQWWMAAIGVGVIALVGILVLRFSHAGTATRWDGHPNYNTVITNFRQHQIGFATWGDGNCIGTNNSGDWCRTSEVYNYNGKNWQVWTRKNAILNKDGFSFKENGPTNACATIGKRGNLKLQRGSAEFPSDGQDWYIWEMSCQ